MEFEVVLEVGVTEVALCVKRLLEANTVGRNLFPWLVGITSSSTSTTAS